MAAYIAYRDLISAATLSVVAPNVVEPGYPLDMVRARPLSDFTRISGSSDGNQADATILVDLGAGYANLPTPTLFGVLGTNGVVSGVPACTMTVSRSNSPAGPWTVVAAPGFVDNSMLPLPAGVVSSASAPASMRYYKFAVTVRTASPYVDIGRLWMGDSIILPNGVDGNWSVGFIDSGTLDSSKGKQVRESLGVRLRAVRVSLSGVETPESFGFIEGDSFAGNVSSLQGLQLDAGCTGEVIMIPRELPRIWTARLGVYGHISQPWEIQHLDGPKFHAEFTVVEER